MPEDDDARTETPDYHARGGIARAKALTKEERSDSGRKAALARWSANMPQATHDGVLKLAGTEIVAAVLPNGKRLLSQGTFLRSLGRSRTPKGGTGGLTTVDGLPFFLQAEHLQRFISDELRLSTTPIHFRLRSGQRTVGYDATLLPMVCEVYLQLRDASEKEGRQVPAQYKHIVKACDALMRGLATVGITALVDEATGYQEVRDRQALQAILEAHLRPYLAAWAKTFPEDFYREIFRLRGWTWKGMSVNRPQAVANYTKDIVYDRITPGLLAELEKKNPVDEKGRRKAKHFQWLSDEIGHPALAKHLHAVTALMRASATWDDFRKSLDRAFPRKGSTLYLPLETT